MNRRPHVLAVSGLALVIGISAAACSSNPPVDARGDALGGGTDGTDAAIRDQVARAAIFAQRCAGTEGYALETCAQDVAKATSTDPTWAGWEGSVKGWSRALDHTSICRALEAHRDQTRLYWAAGVDTAGLQREIVVDVTKGQAAFFTYASNGVRNALDAAPGAYQAVGYASGPERGLLEAWSSAVGGLEGTTGAIDLGTGASAWRSAMIKNGSIARLPQERAMALATIISVDGSKYGAVPAASKLATRAFATTLTGIELSVDGAAGGDVLTFKATSAAGLSRGGSTAAAILRWAGPRNAPAVHAAVLAAALGELEAHGGKLETYCGAAQTPLGGLSFTAGVIGPRALGDGVPFALPDLPDPPKDDTRMVSKPADCSNGGELDCAEVFPGQDKVCSQNGPASCCVAPTKVTTACAKNEDCKAVSATAQCARVRNESEDGLTFSCQEPNPSRCAAGRDARPGEKAGLCGDDTTQTGKGTYTYHNPFGTAESHMQKAAQAACSKADDAAVSACHRSALLCIATAGKPFHAGEAQCSYDAGAGDATCTCTAAVNCSYRILY